MDEFISNNLDTENSITTKSPDQQQLELEDKFININNESTSDDLQQNNPVAEINSSCSGTSKNSLDLSSDFIGVGTSRVKVIEDVEPINVASNNENENDTISTIDSENQSNIRKRIRTIIDSDTEDEEETELTSSITLNKSVSIGTNFDKNKLTDKSKVTSSRLRIDSDSDDEVDDITAGNNDNGNLSDKDNDPIIKIKSKKFSDLIDSESDNENDNGNQNYSSNEESSEHIHATNVLQKKYKKNKSEKKQTGTKRAAKDEAMRHIHSETQRLLREAPVSLPYHRPKQRSLQEFLNRKKIAPSIPQASTVAAKLKMCTAIVSEVVKEKEKEAELFYKSSDSEDDEIPISNTNESNNLPSSSSLSSITSAHIPVDEVQKLEKVDVQIAQNKEKITQQSNMHELGVSRKLFVNDVKDSFDVEFSNTPVPVRQVDDDSDAKNRLNEFEEGLKEIGMSRKLLNKTNDDYTDESSGKCDSLTPDSLTLTTDHNINNKNQTINEIIQSLDDNYTDNTDIDKNNSTDDKISQFITISSSKSTEDSQDSLQVSQNNKIIDLTATQSTLNSNTSSLPSRNIEISDTSLISNEESKESNDRNLIPEKSSSLSSEMCLDDTSQSSDPGDCGVVGLPPPIFDSDPVIKIKPPQITSMTLKKNALKNIPKLKPKLHGAPGTVIDFTRDSKPNKEAINTLFDRFLTKHAKVNKHIEVNSEVSIIQTEKTAEGLQIYKDILPYKFPTATEASDDPEMNKPGAKLMRLKEELKKKMASKRNEEWKQREKELLMDEDELEADDDVEELEPEDKDEISAMDAEISDVEESEPEENDILITDKKRKSCAFGDDEAEVDEDEVMDLSDDEHEEDDEDDGENEKVEDEEDEEDDEDDNDKSEDTDDELENTQENKKKFSRIVAADDDSNSEDATAIDDKIYPVKFERKRTDVDMFDDDDEEDELYVNEKNLQESQSSSIFKTPLTSNNISNTYESRTNQFSSFNINSPDIDFNSKLNDLNSQASDFQSQNDNGEIKNKLYNVQDCNVTDEELMALCSGRFTDNDNNTQNENQPRLTGLIDSTLKEDPITESQIIGMCSGTFSSQALLSSTDLSCNVDDTSQEIRLTLDDTSQNSNDNILGKKHEEQRENSGIQSFLDIASSSDDEIDNKISSGKNKKVLKKKKVKQLVLSDDEDEEINEEDEEEDDLATDDDEEKFIDYDSEENEVVVVNKKDLQKVAANFVDAEAELSESEWGSDDEDEKGMDKLELEEGDAEEIDEDQMRDQLGKLHARQVLDDDQRDVRMLKEMLFDDGDLHTDGAGRERRFKWRNIDKLGEENLLGPTNHDDDNDDDDNQIDPVDLANEIEWRKHRLEREKFMEEKTRSDGDLDPLESDINIDSGGEFLKLGIKVLKKCKTSIEIRSNNVEKIKPIVPRTVSELIGTPESNSRMLYKAMKRGSFLARGDEALARLAGMINKSDTVDLAPKHSRNFLFTHISPSVNEEDNEDGDNDSENKRDVNEKSNDKMVRKRKPAAGGTPRTAKKPKFDSNRSSGKKLF
ncbi:hypothetical protein PV328_002772 [Microctonus aethiopoides]|uniref:Claspin n=2 Tax=Microctonus aethiopoides TaxID=144406 RepID=A0AA39KJS6_9HYME|nr:hypothetical protein PV328_002772 [Microctonus aethiopoides]